MKSMKKIQLTDFQRKKRNRDALIVRDSLSMDGAVTAIAKSLGKKYGLTEYMIFKIISKAKKDANSNTKKVQ